MSKVLLYTVGIVLALLVGAAGTYVVLAKTLTGGQQYSIDVAMPDGTANTLSYGAWPALQNAEFFADVKQGFVKEKASFIEANLTSMTLRVYRDGEQALEVPIKSKGNEGSWWETPSGIYKAQGKEKNHFSSFGHVYMPWSIPFQGNFFIHGWPYYEDGTAVAEGYSGGCIRLEDAYAEQVYNLTDVGMPILVFEEQSDSAEFTYTLSVPGVTAAQYVAVDLDTATALATRGANQYHTTSNPMPLLGALVASEYQNIEKELFYDRNEAQEDSSRLSVSGTPTLSIYQMFFPLLMEYDTFVLTAFTEYFGANRFYTLLGEKMRAIGMQHTTLSEDGAGEMAVHTTPEDVYALLRYLHQNRSFLLDFTAGTAQTRVYGSPVWNDVSPTHPFALQHTYTFLGGTSSRVPFIDPAKEASAFTEDILSAIQTPEEVAPEALEEEDVQLKDMITVLEVPINGSPRTIGFIVFGSSNPEQDTKNLISYVERTYGR